MIENFFNFIENYEPKLVSFNGKNFDMPVLVLRALKYNLKAATYLDTQSDKWNNYKTRFSELKASPASLSLSCFMCWPSCLQDCDNRKVSKKISAAKAYALRSTSGVDMLLCNQ